MSCIRCQTYQTSDLNPPYSELECALDPVPLPHPGEDGIADLEGHIKQMAERLTPAELACFKVPTYVFGFIVSLKWVQEYGKRLTEAGRINVEGPPQFDFIGRNWIYSHFRDVSMNELNRRNRPGVTMYWSIASNSNVQSLEGAHDPELVEQLKKALSTDSEPMWYPVKRGRIRA
ncbi:hypothetical protein QCA50_011950 [Cerrena zonata]|uniref:Uncharacterized protein n=1 Tax=Cerrena zonata TaxID=2478898 RepID=A0AAW0G617_9APHY